MTHPYTSLLHILSSTLILPLLCSCLSMTMSTSSTPFTNAFRTGQMLPMKIDPLSKIEIHRRLGLKTDPQSGIASIGSGPHQQYNLHDEHEVLCPITGSHQGILCTIPGAIEDTAESIANNLDLVQQVVLSGSLAASIRNRCKDGNSLYYLPFVITLVESLMADEVETLLDNMGDKMGQMIFNGGGLETNEVLMDLSDNADDCGVDKECDGESVMLYSCNTYMDQVSATSDVYLFPSPNDAKGKVWRFSIEYKVATVDLSRIPSFGMIQGKLLSPLRPDVWLKDDSY